MANQIPFNASRIEAEENFLIDFQFLIQELMVAKKINRVELSERTGLSAARISQILGSQANPTVKTMARIFHALGESVHLSANCAPVNERAQGPTDDQWMCIPETEEPAIRKDTVMVAMIKRSFASNDNTVFIMGTELVPEAA
jgi:transcriptional regulator with XRE-family HTH domain